MAKRSKARRRSKPAKQSFRKPWVYVILSGIVAVLLVVFSSNSQQAKNQDISLASVQGANTGFDEFGYNRGARIFNGTGSSWCQGKLHWNKATCDGYMGAYANDKLVMKWNAEWDRGNSENWNNPPYKAWTDNEWNGRVNGSGEIWHYKIAWDEGCANGTEPSTTAVKGSDYCIWGAFAMLSSQGSVADHSHAWEVLLEPAGYGGYGR